MNETCKALYQQATGKEWAYDFDPQVAEKFAELVRADERRRITNLMLYMHNKAAPYHNYYKHAAVEINRRAGEGEKI